MSTEIWITLGVGVVSLANLIMLLRVENGMLRVVDQIKDWTDEHFVRKVS